MKKNQLTFLLVGVFFLCTLGTVVLMFKYRSSSHALQELQPVVQNTSLAQRLFQSMESDANEYSKKNPEIIKFFQQNAPAPTSAAK